MQSKKQNGFTLLEMMITISFIMIMIGITYMAMKPILQQSHVNRGYDTTLMVLRNTRNLAITQGHEYYVNFNPAGFVAGTIQVEYQPPAVGNGAAPPLEQVFTYNIPSDIAFQVQPGFPTNTPDGFGSGVNAIDFGQALAGEPLNYVVFMPDGSSQDQFGNYNSGIVYLTDTTLPSAGSAAYAASRAVTVWGATGRVRGWRLDQQGTSTYVWVQQ
jgi:type II secretory pathway pseudopilin PulG